MTENLTYILPLKWETDGGVEEMTSYLEWLSERCDVIIVDGSAPEVYSRHASSWSAIAKHVPPDCDLHFAMGKVNGVITGIRCAATDYLVIADDDVRYDDESLQRVKQALDDAELVRPQNYFDPLPWHAAWDTSRTLLNRSFRADYPGTLGLRRGFFMELGGTYDGDCMFENLELIRTIKAGGGRIASPLDLYVRRIPPDAEHFWSQRVRQAYDDLAQPARLVTFLSLLPALAVIGPPHRKRVLAAVAALAISLAEIGRRRAGGTAVFSAYTSCLAPAWITERAVCSWLAVASRVFRGGIPYGGGVVPRAANSPREHRLRIDRHRREHSPLGT
jgi:Glycosyl transferase family 21